MNVKNLACQIANRGWPSSLNIERFLLQGLSNLWHIQMTRLTNRNICRDHSEYGLSQWETTLLCNVVSQWLSPHPEWSLIWSYLYISHVKDQTCWWRYFVYWHWNMNLDSWRPEFDWGNIKNIFAFFVSPQHWIGVLGRRRNQYVL